MVRISYDGTCNKACVTKEYYKQIKKIWTVELSAFNIAVSYNVFTVAVLMPKFWLLDWMLVKTQAIDVKTQKMLTSTNSFATWTATTENEKKRVEACH